MTIDNPTPQVSANGKSLGRILITLMHPGYARNYEDVLRMLLDRGHRIHLAMLQAAKQSRDRIGERLGEEYSNISLSPARKPERDGWRNIRWTVRALADYSRYLHPRYRESAALRDRVVDKLYGARGELGAALSMSITLFVWIFGRFSAARLSDELVTLLLRVERVLPTSKVVEDMIRDFRPDLVISTPYVAIGSREPDYLRAAKRLGVKTGLFVASWDNLTNKGLIKIQPDRVFVWNEIQRREAAELHGIAPERVVVTGAQRFDRWFEQRPHSDRNSFIGMVGLDPSRPYLLYLCSSPFIAPDEVSFVNRFLEQLRKSDSSLRDIGVLVRPHPQNAKQWIGAELRPAGNATVWPPTGEQPVDALSRASFYDSMYHSAAVLGINTSALIEAGIVGRTVHTVLDEQFAQTQEGTLHFHYLLAEHGGLLYVATSMDELIHNLERAVNGELDREHVHRFVEAFVRPHGLDVPATPIFVEAVEQLLCLPAPAPERLSIADRVLLAALIPLSWVARPLPRIGPRRLLARVMWWRRQSGDLSPMTPEREAKREVHRRRSRERKKDALIAVGPWLHDVGSELLYWIPFLRWASQNNNLEPSRLIAVSRGGNRSWYTNLCDGYLDVLDLIDPALYKQTTLGRSYQEMKGRTTSPAVLELVKQYVADESGGPVRFLEPSILYQIMGRVWSGRAAMRHAERFLDPRRLRAPDDPLLEGSLPPDFVAVQFGFTPAFPDIARNRAAISRVIERVSAKIPLVVLNPPLGERTTPFDVGAASGVVRLVEDLEPGRSLAVQTFAIATSRGFIGTYGSLCQLAAAHGVPSVGLYSEGYGLCVPDVDWTDRLVRLTGTEFSLMHVSCVDLVGRMLATTGTVAGTSVVGREA